MVTTEDSASERLFTASSVTAIEFDAKPTNALNAESMTFAIMPITLVLTMVFSLSAASAAMSFCSAIFNSPLFFIAYIITKIKPFVHSKTVPTGNILPLDTV